MSTNAVTARASASFADAEQRPFWLERGRELEPLPPLDGDQEADLLVIGGGLTGVWAALQAIEREPSRSVALLEATALADGASGRNGGFCLASLTHGIENGIRRWPDEMATIERLGAESFGAIRETIARHRIECSFEETGEVDVALAPHQVPWLAEAADLARRFGWAAHVLDREQMQAEVRSPTYLGGVWVEDGAIVDPARLNWGLARAALDQGARVHERSPVERLVPDGAGVRADCAAGSVRARSALVATSAFPPVIRAVRHYMIPVYDYVLVTEPLDSERRAAVGWQRRQGVGDMGNRFHYYRLTDDDRILWGGYDAIYHYGNRVDPSLEQRPATFELLASQFFDTFPQLEGVRFTHRWAGAVDTCSRFSMMFCPALDGRAVYVGGFTGLGVGASRFGAAVGLDLLAGRRTEATELSLVRTRPIPFPPEPARWLGVELTRRALARADRNQGRRGPWLRLLDRLGMGFDT
jgi:glycine/D-amino acid oxidase-like deaminating enzyme